VASVRSGLRELAALYWGSGLCDDVPALAWFLLASLVPLALGLTALAALVLGDYAQAQALAARAAGVLPRDVHDQIVQLVLRTKHDSPLLIAAALAGMVWTSSGAVGVVERCMSRLLSRERMGPVLGKMRNLGLAAALALVILLLVLGASAGTGLVGRLAIDASFVRALLPLVSLVIVVTFCAALYRVMSGGEVSWRSAFAGGALGGLFLLVTPTVAGYYMALAADRTPVGVFLVLAGVLFTCYLVALGLLLGAGVTARVFLGRPLA
jgi:membrane protein